MSEEKNAEPEAEVLEESETEETVEPVEVDPIEELRAENGALLDKLQRTAAELENVRRRHRKELSDARMYGQEPILSDFASLHDDLARALDHIRSQGEGAEELVRGVEMVAQKAGGLLQKHGVSPIEADGVPFDPNIHDALHRQEDLAVPKNTVITVFQRGYKLHDRVIKPAGVVVSTGGPDRVEADGTDEPN